MQVKGGTSPEDIQNLMRKLSEEDGADLRKVVKKAFSEGWGDKNINGL